MQLTAEQFQEQLLNWFDSHGRKNLPWQENKTPYRVWVSEIMLQQTQVTAVIPYYQRFMHHFPELADLANADTDEVLHLWAGLGYYSRARNLHKAARMVMQDFGGEFPSNQEDLVKLPGIGRSTAGAILAIAFKQRTAILDGNVKRVLTRYLAVDAVVDRKIENKLWEVAQVLTPTARSADYTQAIMDLGATLCTRGKPDCSACPFVTTCSAHAKGIAEMLPMKKARVEIPTREATFLILRSNAGIYLEKRPPHGIWGGLWGLPQLDGNLTERALKKHVSAHFSAAINSIEMLDTFQHVFSHFRLNIHPALIEINAPAKVMASTEQIWYNLHQPQAVGLPKPVVKILRNLGGA